MMSRSIEYCKKCGEELPFMHTSHICDSDVELYKEFEAILHDTFKGNRRRMKRALKKRGIYKYNKFLNNDTTF